MKKLLRIIIIAMMIISVVPTNVFAAGYDDISRKFSGYGISTSVTHDKKIGSEFTVGELVNNSKTATTVEDSFSAKKSITFSAGCDTEISSSVGVTNGVVKGDLGAKIKAKYSFSSNFTYKYTKTIKKKVAAKSKCTVKVQPKGDYLKVYYKHFAAWITTSKGKGTIKVPRYYSFIVYD